MFPRRNVPGFEPWVLFQNSHLISTDGNHGHCRLIRIVNTMVGGYPNQAYQCHRRIMGDTRAAWFRLNPTGYWLVVRLRRASCWPCPPAPSTRLVHHHISMLSVDSSPTKHANLLYAMAKVCKKSQLRPTIYDPPYWFRPLINLKIFAIPLNFWWLLLHTPILNETRVFAPSQVFFPASLSQECCNMVTISKYC